MDMLVEVKWQTLCVERRSIHIFKAFWNKRVNLLFFYWGWALSFLYSLLYLDKFMNVMCAWTKLLADIATWLQTIWKVQEENPAKWWKTYWGWKQNLSWHLWLWNHLQRLVLDIDTVRPAGLIWSIYEFCSFRKRRIKKGEIINRIDPLNRRLGWAK